MKQPKPLKPEIADPQLQIAVLELQLVVLTDSFDAALKRDATFGESKEIYHELRMLIQKIEELRNGLPSQ